MVARKLVDFLDQERVPYQIIRHTPSYTAQGVAAATHISGKELVKTVIVKVEGVFSMVVLPASRRVDIPGLRRALGRMDVLLASEEEFKDLFPGCETGAMPPFGNLYGMPVIVDVSVTDDDEIVFNAGSHAEVIRLGYRDFERLARPRIMHICGVLTPVAV
jgi:Ala-tRNA(Pro) deacylase